MGIIKHRNPAVESQSLALGFPSKTFAEIAPDPRICLDAVLMESGDRRAKPASALKSVELDGILAQLLEMVGIDSPSRHLKGPIPTRQVQRACGSSYKKAT